MAYILLAFVCAFYSVNFVHSEKIVDNIVHNLNIDVSEEYKSLSSCSIEEFCKHFGYPFEKHSVTTEDGYILEIHRIPHGKDNEDGQDKPVVFLQHGILSSSFDWLLLLPEKALGFLLADAGFDVWLGNYRGNEYSQKHEHLDPISTKYWDFSWHEMGIYDLPAMIDFVLKETQRDDLYYIGHSQGTTGFYVMCSEKPEYNKKIKAQFSLAPVAFCKHMTSPIARAMAMTSTAADMLSKHFGFTKFNPKANHLKNLGEAICLGGKLQTLLCSNALFATVGFNPKNVNMTMLPIILSHTPSTSAVKQVFHYSQLLKSGRFCQYDYGPMKNYLKYGSVRPTNYDLSKITAPVYLYYSHNDWLSNPIDVLKLALKLPNCKGKICIEDKLFSHVDYLIGNNAKLVLYDKLIEQIKH